MWLLDPIQLILEVTGGHSFPAETLQSPPYKVRIEAQKKGNVGQFCCYKNITCLSIITTGVKMTDESPDTAKGIKTEFIAVSETGIWPEYYG